MIRMVVVVSGGDETFICIVRMHRPLHDCKNDYHNDAGDVLLGNRIHVVTVVMAVVR